MNITERDNLIQTYKNQIKDLQELWVQNRDADTRSLLEKAYEEHDKAKLIPITPEVGMGATGGAGSDCYPYTIVSVSKDGKKIEV
jgi:hypothetical protein